MNATAKIIPAIDLIDGKVVRLYQGDYDKVTYYDYTLAELLKKFWAMGFNWVHVVDLTAARFSSRSDIMEKCVYDTYMASDIRNEIELQLMNAHRNYGINIELCGGIRTIDNARLLKCGAAQRLCIGSMAYTSPTFFDDMCNKCGADKISLGMDLKLDRICIHGWEESIIMSWQDFILEHADNCKHIICTDILKDGTKNGCSLELYKRIISFLKKNHIKCDLIASGGVSKNDLPALHSIGINNAIIGKEILDNIN